MKTIILVLFFNLIFVATSYAQSKLPPCKKDIDSTKFHNCYGSAQEENNFAYIGEWKNGNFHGKGTYTRFDKSLKYPMQIRKHEGEFKFGKPHGTFKNINQDGSYEKEDWYNGVRHGKYKVYDRNNRPLYEWEVFQGKTIKDTTFYDPPLNDRVVKQEVNYDREGNETTTYMYNKDGSKNLARDVEKEKAMARASENDRKMIERAQRVNNVNKKNNEESSSPKDFLKKIFGK
jgi:hypothetical protein